MVKSKLTQRLREIILLFAFLSLTRIDEKNFTANDDYTRGFLRYSINNSEVIL